MPTGHAMLALPIREAPGGHARRIQGQKSPASGGTFRRFQNEIEAYRRAAFCRRDVGCAGGRGVGPGQDRQDRRDLSLERQRRQRRRARQGRDRNRGRDHQQRQSRARQFAGDQECRPQGPRRRQGRSGVRRQPGQPRGRAEPGASPDHRREGGRAHRRLSVRHHADRERDRREIRHSLRQRRVGRRQPHRARLQMVLPRHAGGVGLRQDLSRLPQGHEGRRAEGRQHRAGA